MSYVFFIDPSIPGAGELSREITLFFEEVNQNQKSVSSDQLLTLHQVVDRFNNSEKKVVDAIRELHSVRKGLGLVTSH